MNIQAIEDEIERNDILIKAAENWSPLYRKNKQTFNKLIRIEARMERVLRGYFRDFAERAIKYINWNAYNYQLYRIHAASEFEVSVLIEDGPIGLEDGFFIQMMYEPMEDAVTTGALAGEILTGKSIGVSKTSDYIQDATMRLVANLVGKRVDENGIIIDNPKAKYRVTETVRNDIRKAIAKSLNLGEDQTTALARIRKSIKNPKRAAMIARTEAVNGYQQGLLTLGGQTGAVGKEWQTVNYADICGENARQGIIPINQTFVSGNASPAAHPNCVIGSTKVSSTSNLAATKRVYKGWIVKITTAGGNKLTITPNHPILTDNGWVVAGLLKKGDNVISCVDSEGVSSVINPDNKYMPTSIKKVFNSFRRSSGMSTTTMPTSTVDFHGDGSNGKVNIVRSDSFLSNNRDVVNTKLFSKSSFIKTNTHLSCFSRFSAFNLFLKRVRTSTRSFMSCFSILSMLFGRSLRRHEPIGFGISPKSDPTFCESSSYDASVNTKLHSKLIDRFAGNVFIDDIVSIKRIPYFGHVYNLETDSGWYISNNIVTHNCRCGLVLIYPEDPRAKKLLK